VTSVKGGPSDIGYGWSPCETAEGGNGVGRFPIWLSGARRQILDECPTDRPKYVGIGVAILITATMAAVSLAFALVTALKVELPFAIPFAIAWGLAIMSLDRLFVVSLPRKGSKLAHLLRATPRVLLALLLGFVISTPFVLQAFRPEIEHEITVLHTQAEDAYLKSAKNSQLQQDINKDAAQVGKLTARAGGGPVPTPPQNAQVTTLRSELSQAETKENNDLTAWNCQLYGKSGGQACAGVTAIGNGPVAQADHAAYLQDVARVQQLNREIAAEQQQASQDIANAQAASKAEAGAQLPAAQSALKAAQAQQAQEEATFSTQNDNDSGLLIRMEALDAVTAGNSTLNAARWLLFVLFVVIDCMPVMVKVMLNLGPETNYDRMLEAEERKQLRVADNNRAVRQAAEKLAVETVLGEAQSRMEGWRTPIPEITQNIIAARTRVEAKRLNAWENHQSVHSLHGNTPAAEQTVPNTEPPVGFIAWPWVTGSSASSRWRPVASLRTFAVRTRQILAAHLRRAWLRPSNPRAGTTSGSQPYGAPFSPGMPSSPNGARHGVHSSS
jgi:hypothetical protein